MSASAGRGRKALFPQSFLSPFFPGRREKLRVKTSDPNNTERFEATDMEYILKITPALLRGSLTTLALFAVVLPLSLPLGFVTTLLQQSRFKPVSLLANAYVFVMRGTPLMLQLFFFYFGLPFLPFVGRFLTMSAFPCACLSFTLNYAAYFAEIFRGGLLSIPTGQYEASQVLGLSRAQTMLRVIIPQMIRVTLPSIGNEAITLVKDTALVTAIALPELLHFAKGAVTRDFTTAPFVVAAVIYLLINLAVSLAFKYTEKKFRFGER